MNKFKNHPYTLSKHKKSNKILVEIDESIKTDNEWQQFYYEERHKVALSNLYINAIELDKLLLAFNVGSLAFTITLLLGINFDVIDICEKIALFFGVFATFFSVISIYFLLEVFKKNMPYLRARIEDNLTEESKIRLELDEHDDDARFFFLCSIVFIVVFIIFILLHNIYFPSVIK